MSSGPSKATPDVPPPEDSYEDQAHGPVTWNSDDRLLDIIQVNTKQSLEKIVERLQYEISDYRSTQIQNILEEEPPSGPSPAEPDIVWPSPAPQIMAEQFPNYNPYGAQQASASAAYLTHYGMTHYSHEAAALNTFTNLSISPMAPVPSTASAPVSQSHSAYIPRLPPMASLPPPTFVDPAALQAPVRSIR
jgi:hypothetical protein